MIRAMTTYLALADCRAGGVFRRKGDVFAMPALETAPSHLKDLGAQGTGETAQAGRAAKKTGKPASVPRSAQAGRADIGAGEVTPASNVTSADMVTQ